MIGEVTEKVLASIADSAGSLPDDYIGSDGLLYCGQCNTRKEREIIWFDGKPKKVPVMCKCRAEEERLKKEQMQKEEEMRSIQRAKVSSMMDDTFRTACFANYQIRNGNERHLKVAKNTVLNLVKCTSEIRACSFGERLEPGKAIPQLALQIIFWRRIHRL